MKQENRSLLGRAWRKLFPRKQETPALPARLSPMDKSSVAKPVAKAARTSIEPLEGRIAPAALLPGGKVLRYTDADGDNVTVTFSKAIFADVSPTSLDSTLDSVFTFSTGDAHSDAGVLQQLQFIDLTKVPTVHGKNPAAGVSISIVSTPAHNASPGDGLANIGAINATGLPLGSVTIDGDLGHIDSGSANSVVGLKSLTVASLGVKTDTQAGASPDYTSQIVGELGSFKAGTVLGAYVHVINGQSTFGLPTAAIGKIGSITIDHTLSARTIPAGSGTAPVNDGMIQSASDIGAVKIGSGQNGDGLIGGWGVTSGSLMSGAKISSVTINGDITGGAGSTSGSLQATGNIGTVKIVGDIVGGAGLTSGSIDATAKLSSLTLIGNLTGDTSSTTTSTTSGSINVTGVLGKLSITGNITGGASANSGTITAKAAIDSLTLHGNLTGGAGDNTGEIKAQSFGKLDMTGDIVGAAGNASGSISATANLDSFVLQGNILGGTKDTSGTLTVGGTLGTALIHGNLSGGSATNSGRINLTGGAKSLTVQGDILGAAGSGSGSINSTGALKTVSIVGHVAGGDGTLSGVIHSDAMIGKISIGTAIDPGLLGGSGDGSGVVSSGGAITSINIIGDVLGAAPKMANNAVVAGSSAAFAGGISAAGDLTNATISGSIKGLAGSTATGEGFVEAGSMGTIKIAGGIVGSNGIRSGTLTSGGDIKSLSVGVALAGGAGDNSGSVFAGLTGTGKLVSAIIGAARQGSTPVAHGLIGGAGRDSGSVGSGNALGKITIEGAEISGNKIALQGAAGDYSASIYAQGTIDALTLDGNVLGADGDYSAAIQSHVMLGSLTINGNTIGGSGPSSASISSLDTSDFTQAGNMGKVTINGDLIAGTGDNSAQIRADGTITSVSLGTLSATPSTGTGGSLAGALLSGMGTVGDGSVGSITLAKLLSTIDVGGRLGAFTANSEVTGATVHVANDLGALTVHGSVTDSTFTAQGQAVQGKTTDLAMGKITIDHSVVGSQFLAGYDLNSIGANPDAQIGAVVVKGDWTASNLVAGASAGNDGKFGTADDVSIGAGSPQIVASIASISIAGNITGDTDDQHHFGFVAEAIGVFHHGNLTSNITVQLVTPIVT